MDYWYLWVIFALLCVLTVFVLRKASAALCSSSAERERVEAELKRLKQLKDTYQNVSAEIVDAAEPRELLEGANAVLQAKVEKAADAEACFATFTDAQKYMYTLLYYLEDSRENAVFFLRNNGEPLLGTAAPALAAIGEKTLAAALDTYFQTQKEQGDILTDEALQETYAQTVQPEFDESRILAHAKAYMQAHRTEIF